MPSIGAICVACPCGYKACRVRQPEEPHPFGICPRCSRPLRRATVMADRRAAKATRDLDAFRGKR